MRTALFLLLLLAIAAVPGSLVPQRSSDPNGVVQYFNDNPGLAPVLDAMQFFDVYTSVWFSSIYLLLFVSLIGCVVPRTMHHLKALRAKPPKTPARLERLAGFTSQPAPAGTDAATAIEAARQVLRGAGYRAQLFDGQALSVSAERGYARETGNLVFHTALIGVLIAVGIGGGFGYAGQKVVVEGQTFVNVLGSYDSFNPGRFFTDAALAPYRLVLKKFTAVYEEKNLDAYGQAIDYRADVTAYQPQQQAQADAIKVNEPLSISGTNVYLLGNGYAPRITVRDGDGNVAFTDSVPFLPQDTNLTSIGVIKVPDALPKQIGMIGFFYPTAKELSTGAFTSIHPDLRAPMLSLRVFTGDLGLGNGEPKSVYELDTDGLTEVAGARRRHPRHPAEARADRRLCPAGSAPSPSRTWTRRRPTRPAACHGSRRSTSTTIRASSGCSCSSSSPSPACSAGLFIPRRRVWVKAVETDGGITPRIRGTGPRRRPRTGGRGGRHRPPTHQAAHS